MGSKKVFLSSAIFIFTSFAFLLLFPDTVHAVTVSIDNYPQTLTQDPFSITVSVSGASPATNYLRVDLYKENTTNYFGETFNGTDWYGDSTYSQYFPITIDSTEKWNGEVQARIGNPSQTEYDWQGAYRMRIRRYTGSGGSNATEANNSSQTITIDIPQPSPSPSPDPTPTTAASVAKSPSPTPLPSIAPSPKISPNLKLSSPIPNSGQILGSKVSEATSSSSSIPQSSPDPSNEAAQTNIKIAAFFLGSGAVIIVLSLASFLWYKKKQKQVTDNGPTTEQDHPPTS